MKGRKKESEKERERKRLSPSVVAVVSHPPFLTFSPVSIVGFRTSKAKVNDLRAREGEREREGNTEREKRQAERGRKREPPPPPTTTHSAARRLNYGTFSPFLALFSFHFLSLNFFSPLPFLFCFFSFTL